MYQSQGISRGDFFFFIFSSQKLTSANAAINKSLSEWLEAGGGGEPPKIANVPPYSVLMSFKHILVAHVRFRRAENFVYFFIRCWKYANSSTTYIIACVKLMFFQSGNYAVNYFY